MAAKGTEQEYLTLLKKNKVPISMVGPFSSMSVRTLHRCNKCLFEWEAKPSDVYRKHGGCRQCAGLLQHTTDVYCELLGGWGSPLVLLEDYVNNNTPIAHRCEDCSIVGDYAPVRIKTAKGKCPSCNIKRARTTLEYNNELKEFGSTLTCIGTYHSLNTKTKHYCSRCEMNWMAYPGYVIGTKGACKNCHTGANHSKVALDWLQAVSKECRIKIQTILDGCEFSVPGTNYRVDGYNKRLGIVFEFYGDKYHGNPKLYTPRQKCHPFTAETAGFLYRKTIEREKKLGELGYVVVAMWEHDWYQDPDRALARSVRRVLKLKTGK